MDVTLFAEKQLANYKIYKNDSKVSKIVIFLSILSSKADFGKV